MKLNSFIACALFAASFLVQADTLPLAPGYAGLNYEIPVPGSYELPVIEAAGDGLVVDSTGKKKTLHEIFDNKFVLLSFMYSSCNDVNGCPLSAFVFYQLKTAMKKNPELAKNLSLISLSFDPGNDTPETMRLYGNNFKYAGDSGKWHFLTTESEDDLQPLLKAYNQDIQRKLNKDNQSGNDYSHILRVFLIDPDKQIRNIYSVAFLHAELIKNDLETLVKERADRQLARLAATDLSTLSVIGPGDIKQGYETGQYRTRSRALELRSGKQAELISWAKQPPLGLPPLAASSDLSVEKITLGRKLFFDRRLSLNSTFSCAMCHVPEQGFSSNELATAVGIEGRTVRRNSPSLYNVGYATRLFHDGREDNLAQQVWAPLLAKNEMGNPSVGYVINKIKKLPDYRGLFEAVFNGQGPGMETIGNAISAYELTLNSANSAFDQWHYAGKENAVSDDVKQGFKVFTGKADCSSCHLVQQDSSLFTDYELHNTGIGYRASMGEDVKTEKVQLAPGIFVDVSKALIDKVSEPVPADLGLYEITENPQDRWKFKTPGLRNVALTAPYMHDGSLSSLESVVEFYDRGGIQNELLDPRIKPLNLSNEEKNSLVAFLKSLTGSNVAAIVADAFAAPVGDTTKADPNWAHALQPDSTVTK